MMDKIERLVELPEGTAALHKYARYYAQQDSKVVALYRIPSFMGPPGKSELEAGQRRWVADYHELPGILDGGCYVVDVVFNPTTQKFERIECNGPS